MDPWSTSWYSDVWQNSVPRGIALGKTIGEIYSEGIKKVGILYVADGTPQWWWDLAENVCLYGDPDLRVWTPSTEYSSNNHWSAEDVESLRYSSSEGFSIDGHTPFGSDNYPNAKTPKTFWSEYLIVIIALVTIVLLVILAIGISAKKK